MKVRNESEGVIDIKKYTGLVALNVDAFNPNNAKLEQLGYTIKEKDKEPVYYGVDKNGNKFGRLAFYLSATVAGESIRTSISFFFQADPVQSKDGSKYQFIDKLGRTTWATDVNAITSPYFDKESAQNVYGKGHEQFIKFIRAWANVESQDDTQLKAPQDIANGKFAEVEKWFNIIAKSKNRVQVLLAIKGEYMVIYPDYFAKGGNKSTTYWKKHLDKVIDNGLQSGYHFPYDIQNDLKLQPYVDENTSIGNSSFPRSSFEDSEQNFEVSDDESLF